jgi:hypothetical protein
MPTNSDLSRQFFLWADQPDFPLWFRIFRNPVFGPGRAGCEKGHVVAAIQLIKEKHPGKRHASSTSHREVDVFR